MPLIVRHPLSNKPQWGPISIQDKEHYPFADVYADGTQVSVSRPIPDRLTLMLPMNAALIDELLTPESHADWTKLFMEGLYNDPASVKAHSKFVKGTCVRAQLTIGQAAVTAEMCKPVKTKSWRLRLDFCPAKLGPVGLADLQGLLIEASGGLWNLAHARMLSWITRLDVAADIVGVDLLHLAVRSHSVSKIVQYLAGNGDLETQYGAQTTVVGDKPKFGGVQYRIYDKRKQLIEQGLPPPCGDIPVTRIERVQRWAGSAPSLDGIVDMANAFDPLVVSYTRKACALLGWEDFSDLRRRYSFAQTAKLLRYPPDLMSALEARYASLPFNVFDKAIWWTGWPAALADTGLATAFSDA